MIAVIRRFPNENNLNWDKRFITESLSFSELKKKGPRNNKFREPNPYKVGLWSDDNRLKILDVQTEVVQLAYQHSTGNIETRYKV